MASANAAEGGTVPTYQYACTECGDRTEAVQRFTDDPLTVCTACGGKLRKVFSPVGIVFKGSGFYRTDSRNGSSTVTAGKDASASGPGSSDGAAKSSDSTASGSSGGESSSSAPAATGNAGATEKKSSVSTAAAS